MKTLLTILLLIITLSCNAQYSKLYKPNTSYEMNTFKDISIPVCVLVTTFATVEYMKYNDNYSKQDGTTVAFTGMATTLVTYYVVKAIKTNSSKKCRKQRIKRLSRL